MRTYLSAWLALATFALADSQPTLTTITNTIAAATGTTTYPSATAYPDYDGGVCENCPNAGATIEKDAGCPSDHPTFYYLDKSVFCQFPLMLQLTSDTECALVVRSHRETEWMAFVPENYGKQRPQAETR
jgi:hypothetical protein